MRGLTVRQPWAAAVAGGWKRAENRSRRTAYRGPVLIHAGLSRAEFADPATAATFARAGVPVPAPDGLPFGAVVAVAELAGCVRPAGRPGDPWAGGPWCWVLADVRPLADPVPCRGRLGLWVPAPEVLAAVVAQLG